LIRNAGKLVLAGKNLELVHNALHLTRKSTFFAFL